MISSEEEARDFVAQRCDSTALAALDRLAADLKEENERQNLVSRNSLHEVWTRHIADSAQLLDHALQAPVRWLDLGTGAGFPGLVIAIMRPELDVVLVEPRKLRVEWLERCRAAASLSKCTVIGSRLELVDTLQASVISARAFAPLPKILTSAQRFSTNDTVWLLPKGRSGAQEVKRLPRGLRRMFHVEPSITDADSGIVVGRIEDQNR